MARDTHLEIVAARQLVASGGEEGGVLVEVGEDPAERDLRVEDGGHQRHRQQPDHALLVVRAQRALRQVDLHHRLLARVRARVGLPVPQRLGQIFAQFGEEADGRRAELAQLAHPRLELGQDPVGVLLAERLAVAATRTRRRR